MRLVVALSEASQHNASDGTSIHRTARGPFDGFWQVILPLPLATVQSYDKSQQSKVVQLLKLRVDPITGESQSLVAGQPKLSGQDVAGQPDAECCGCEAEHDMGGNQPGGHYQSLSLPKSQGVQGKRAESGQTA